MSRRFKPQGFLVGANEAPFTRWDSEKKSGVDYRGPASVASSLIMRNINMTEGGCVSACRASRLSESRNIIIDLFNILEYSNGHFDSKVKTFRQVYNLYD